MVRLLFLLSTAFSLTALANAGDGQGTPSGLTPEEVIVRMEERFQRQVISLESYQDQRRYSVRHRLLGNSTFWVVQEDYVAPGEKHFEVLERGGSGTVQKRVFARLLHVEQETARETVRPQVDLSRDNYDFRYLGFDEKSDAYKFQASPIGENDYLLRGTIWVNAEDYGVQRIEGEPAKRHSILIQSVHFVHEFARFGKAWFPVHHRSETKLRLFGTAILEIQYFDYRWQTRAPGAAINLPVGGPSNSPLSIDFSRSASLRGMFPLSFRKLTPAEVRIPPGTGHAPWSSGPHSAAIGWPVQIGSLGGAIAAVLALGLVLPGKRNKRPAGREGEI